MSAGLPQGWASVQIAELCDVLKEKGRVGVVPYLEIGNVDIASKNYTFTEKPSVKGCRTAKRYDVLISKVRPTRGAITWIREGELQISSAFTVLRNNGALAEQYLWLYLAWNQDYFNHLGESCTGTMYPTTSDNAIVDFELPIAPLAEQRRIVAKLEKLLGKINACEKRLAKIPVILKRFRQSILAAACSGRLTADWREKNTLPLAPSPQGRGEELPGIPETWRWVKLPDTGEMNRGKSRHRPRNAPFLFGGSYPFIQTGDISQSGGRITSHKQTYSEAGLAQSRLWPDRTICITIAANIAESAILTYPVCFPDSVVGIITTTDVCVPEYVEYFIRVAKADLATFAPATAQKNINIAILNELSVPIPPLPEQQEIVRRVEALFALADQIEARYTRAKAYVDKLTQSILAKAFRGELVPQDPNDEPASELLERTKAEKMEISGKKAGRVIKRK
ncbi:MAG: restriction endonuclease subunit S [Nitrospirae bacterium]|nr:restriction endonuclease subunit S [Nitrospirota bacterium]